MRSKKQMTRRGISLLLARAVKLAATAVLIVLSSEACATHGKTKPEQEKLPKPDFTDTSRIDRPMLMYGVPYREYQAMDSVVNQKNLDKLKFKK